MSDEKQFPAVQLGSFISGDQWVFRADSGDELRATLESVAENANDTIKALNALKQAGVANGVFTGDSASAGKSSKPQERRADSAPPSGDGEVCKHGPMKDLKEKGYRSRWYCSAQNRSEQCKPRN